jgi:hypothetical protein
LRHVGGDSKYTRAERFKAIARYPK